MSTKSNGFSSSFIIFLITLLGILCSFTYNAGFFWKFDIGTQLLTAQDIIESFIWWLPITILLYGLMSVYIIAKANNPQKASSSGKQDTDKYCTDPIDYVFIFGIPIFWALYFLIGVPRDIPRLWAWSSFVFFWGFICHLFIKKTRLDKRGEGILLLSSMIFFIPFILSTTFWRGLEDSSKFDTASKDNSIIYNLNKPADHSPYLILRSLEKGVLVKDRTRNSYLFLTWGEISRVEILYDEKPFQGILCEWFHLRCDFIATQKTKTDSR